MATYNPFPVKSISFSAEASGPRTVACAFDAKLFRSIYNEFAPMRLTIYLRINMRQLSPRPFPVARDSDGKPFWTAPWTNADWRKYIERCADQANMWNSQFWLLPPLSFREYNIKAADGTQFRPNVACRLSVDFEATENPHKTIDVVNLDLSKLDASSTGTFRSASGLYCSQDALPVVDPAPGPGEPATQHVVAHEIGHAIGLPHVGVARRLPLCELALMLKAINMESYLRLSKLDGGSNADVCYGTGQGIQNAGNIMGGGDSFAVENADPWLWAIASMRSVYELPQWRVSLTDPGAGIWLEKWQTEGRVAGYQGS